MAELLRVAREQFTRYGYRRTTMAGIAAAAGLTKRTLYLWHADKESLFRACLMEGAGRFPRIGIDTADEPGKALRDYLAALLEELAADHSDAMGRLFLKEGDEFPELAPMVERGHSDFIVAPLAQYLTKFGLEEEGAVRRTELLVSLALAPVHNHLLLGRRRPDSHEIQRHIDFVVDFFLAGSGSPSRD